MHDRFTDLVGSETGATAAEYALLVALIAVAIIAGAAFLGDSINTKLNDTGTAVNGA
jgi:pilus assembly protein Flp/PilA